MSESFMDLRNSKISTGEDFFPTEVASKVLHDEAIRKAVTRDNPSTCGKKLQFSTMPCQQQGPQQHPKKSTGSSLGSSFRASISKSPSSKASSSSSYQGKGKKF